MHLHSHGRRSRACTKISFDLQKSSTLQYILVFGIGYVLFFEMHRLCPNFAIYKLVDPVLLKLLSAGSNFAFLQSYCGNIFGFLPHYSVYFPHPSTRQLGLEPQWGGGGCSVDRLPRVGSKHTFKWEKSCGKSCAVVCQWSLCFFPRTIPLWVVW